MTQYIKIQLQPGQQKRADISNWMLSTGEVIWIGEDTDVFDDTAPVGQVGPNDPTPSTTYVYSPCTQDDLDELAAQSFEIRKENRHELIRQALIDAIKGIIMLFQVGQSKGIWAAADFDADLRAKFQEWNTLINEHEADSLDPPTD